MANSVISVSKFSWFFDSLSHKDYSMLKSSYKFLNLFICFFLFSAMNLNAADRYSVTNFGNWNSTASWSDTPGGIPGASIPADGDNVYIQEGYNMILDGNTANLNLLSIASGASLTTTSDFTVTATTVIVEGNYNNRSTGAITSTAFTVYGVYEHGINGGSLPTATWESGSTCLVTGWTNSAALNSSFSQDFYNFTWNCPGQTTNVSFAGNVTSVAGTFTLTSTGSSFNSISPFGSPVYGNYLQTNGYYEVTDYQTAATRAVTVNDDFTIYGGSFFQSTFAVATLTVHGNYTMNGGYHFQSRHDGSTVYVVGDFSLSGNGSRYYIAPDNSTGLLTVEGNTTISNGRMYLSGYNITTNTGVGTLNTIGDLTHSGGSFYEYASGSGNIVLNGPTNTSTGAITGTVDITVNSSSALTIGGDLPGTVSFTVNSDTETSGSLILTGNNSCTVTYNRMLRTPDNAGDYHYFSSPVAVNSETNEGKITNVRQWDEVAGNWSTLSITQLARGKGYNLDQAAGSDGNITFTGPAVVSTVTVDATSPYADVTDGTIEDYSAGRDFADGSTHSAVVRDNDLNYGGGGWNMLGNPYTSAINGMAFVDYGRNEDNFEPSYQAVYIYDGAVEGHNTFHYISRTTGWGDPPQTDIQAGQGFFVLAMNDTSTFTFTRSMQLHHTVALYLKSGGNKFTRWPGLQLKVKSGDIINQTAIVFNEEMNAGLDPGYDIGLMGTSPGAMIYTALVRDNGVNFIRQALPMHGAVQNVIPLGIDTKDGGQITISAEIEPLKNFRFWLEDRLTGKFTDLGTDSYTVALPAKSYGTGRFFIHVSPLRSSRPRPEKDNLLDIRIWAMKDRMVVIQGHLGEEAYCEVYDLKGKKIFETILTDTQYNSFTLPVVRNGVYMVRLVDGLNVTTRKIVII